MKIAFLMQESRMGGIEYNSLHLAQALDPSRFQITFLCPEEGKLPDLLRQKKIPFSFYKRPRFFSTSLRVGKGYIFNPFAAFYDFVCFFLIAGGLARFFKRDRFDLVFTKGLLANFYGSWAAQLAGIRVGWDMQEIVSNKKFFGLAACFLNFWAENFVDAIIVSSEAIQSQFMEKARKKIFLIPNGLDLKVYHPDIDSSPVRKEWGIEAGEILIGHIARFTYWKGQKDFLEAAALVIKELPQAKFVLVGSPVFENDTYEREVKGLAVKLGLKGRVLFPGFRDDLTNVMAALNIFVHSSIEPEGCPLTLLAAMAMAKPCVVTSVLGNMEIVQNQNQALLVPPKSPQELAEAILKIARDKSFAKSLGLGARKRIVERYSLDSYAREYAKKFESLAR